MSNVKKIVLGFAVFAMAIGMAAVPSASYAASNTILRNGNNLGDAFILNKLFSGDKILGNQVGGTATLGNLFILDQLFPKTVVTTAAATTTTTTTTKTVARVITLAEKLEGRILIQVQDKGQAWYDNPLTDKRVFLGPTPSDAINAMAKLALGVSNSDFAAFGSKAPSSLSGRFLIKPQDSGKLYYVNPADLSINFIDGASGALQAIEKFGTGISNSDLAKITVQ